MQPWTTSVRDMVQLNMHNIYIYTRAPLAAVVVEVRPVAEAGLRDVEGRRLPLLLLPIHHHRDCLTSLLSVCHRSEERGR
jgi:hypothetical protein